MAHCFRCGGPRVHWAVAGRLGRPPSRRLASSRSRAAASSNPTRSTYTQVASSPAGHSPIGYKAHAPRGDGQRGCCSLPW
jgi:hypothetical protein